MHSKFLSHSYWQSLNLYNSTYTNVLHIIILLQNPTSLIKNKKRNKKLVAPAIELGKHNVPVESKGSDDGSYCSTKGSYLSHK